MIHLSYLINVLVEQILSYVLNKFSFHSLDCIILSCGNCCCGGTCVSCWGCSPSQGGGTPGGYEGNCVSSGSYTTYTDYFYCAGSGCTQACNPNSIAGCSTSCSVCGDSLKEGPEECDDGNTKSGDSCSSTCKTETYSSNYCGDNILFVGSEECDDGNNIDYDSCSSTCNIETYSSSYCGDKILFIGKETCDDGNLISFDGCSNICEIETYKNSYCGD